MWVAADCPVSGSGPGAVRTAIFGGTFNPVHNGHLHLAATVCAELDYAGVVFVPAHVPPHKDADELIAGSHRLAMLRRAVAGHDAFRVDSCELDRRGVSYTIDTVRCLGAVRGRLGVIIGDDLAADYKSWREAPMLAREADLILGRRLDGSATLPFPHQVVRNVQLPLSSRLIRDRLRAGLPVDHLTPPAVLEYILSHGLYGAT
jgi:nicotinate-nucleotide adenylyltransferase